MEVMFTSIKFLSARVFQLQLQQNVPELWHSGSGAQL